MLSWIQFRMWLGVGGWVGGNINTPLVLKSRIITYLCDHSPIIYPLQEGDRLSSIHRTQKHSMVTLGSSQRRRAPFLPTCASDAVTLSTCTAQRRRAQLQQTPNLITRRPTCETQLGLSTFPPHSIQSSVPLNDHSGICGFVVLAEPLIESVVGMYPCHLLRENRAMPVVSLLPRACPLNMVLPRHALVGRDRYNPAVYLASVHQAGNAIGFNSMTENQEEDLCGPWLLLCSWEALICYYTP